MAKKGPGRGRRGSVPRVGGRFASTKTTPPVPAPDVPLPPEVEKAYTEIDAKIGLLEALLEQQRQLSGGDTELSMAVLGKGGAKGVRSQIEELVRTERERLQDLDDPNNAANFAVIESALSLSERAVRSKDRKEQVDIYNKLKFIRETAEKTTGEKSDITKKIAEIIKPVEGVLQKKTGFGAFVKESLAQKVKSIPEMVVRQIPLVGGLLGEYMAEKRAGREELEAYAGRRIESISQAGRKQNELERILMGRGMGGGFAGAPTPPFPGARTVGSVFGGAAGGRLAGMAGGDVGVLGQIAADVRAIKEGVIGNKSGTESLKKKEEALKNIAAAAKADEKQKGLFGGLGKTLSGLLGGGGLLGMFGMGGGGEGQPGILSSVTDWASDKATDWGLKKAWQGTKNLAGKAWQGTKSMLGMGASSAEGAVGTAAKTAAESKSWWSSAWEGTKNMASKGWEGAKSAGSAVIEAGKSVATEAAQIAEAVANPSVFLKSNMGKILSGMKSLGPITAAIEGIIGAFNIYSIKNDPNLSPEDKKEAIGAEISKRFGSAIGGIIGGGLGTAIGPVGTVLGGMAGALGGEWIGDQIASLVGPKGIYDFVSSIPAVGDLIKVEGNTSTAETPTQTTGSISPASTTSTPVGQQAAAMETSRRGVEETKAQTAQGQAQAMAQSNTRASVNQINNQSNTVVNNYNDDLRVRNSEATLKSMERSIL